MQTIPELLITGKMNLVMVIKSGLMHSSPRNTTSSKNNPQEK
jgi:hypothetical protein